MRRTFWIVVLALGTVIGFGAGFAHLCGYGHYGPFGHRGFNGTGFDGPGRIEDRAADACVRAAERVLAERRGAPPAMPEVRPPAPAPAPATPPSAL
jgi:hypothetical protein